MLEGFLQSKMWEIVRDMGEWCEVLRRCIMHTAAQARGLVLVNMGNLRWSALKQECMMCSI